MVVFFTEQILQNDNIWFKMVRYFLSGVKCALVTQVPKSVILLEFYQVLMTWLLINKLTGFVFREHFEDVLFMQPENSPINKLN